MKDSAILWFIISVMESLLKFRVHGVKVQMTTFLLFFGLRLGHRIYAINNNLLKAFLKCQLFQFNA